MKTKSFAIFIPLLLSALLFCSCGYNSMVTLREEVDSQWANVESQYQRRADLVPNLVASVKAYAKHESEIFTQISQARSELMSGGAIDPSITSDPEKLAAYQKAQDALGSSLSRLLAISEAYPDLKANQNFLDLQSQLEGTENRIATERRRYNEAVKAYNATIQRFPGNITANMFHFSPKAYFKAAEGTEAAPTVNFD
ncbi:MAG: LemA family protein [Treponema sp.]|nr:LemA family protein [Treponema sp.]